jgi:hypothetical protein
VMEGLDKKTGGDEPASGQGAEDVGDVESAGETTAAATVSGPAETKPVGADTMVKVSDAPRPERGEDS